MGNTATTYKNVLLVGGTGNLGKHILAALLADKTFDIAVLTRTQSSATFPANVKVIKADYSNEAELVEALTGQEVVISAIGGEGLATNIDSTLIKAALQAGVKWFIPSEFGIDTSHPDAATVPILVSKIAVAKLLEENASRLSYTFIITGSFLDWAFDNGFLGFNIENHTVTLYDEGKHSLSGTTLPSIGRAVVAILHKPELAKNKRLYIADVTFNQQQALEIFQKQTGVEWTKTDVTTENVVEKGKQALADGDIMTGIISLLVNTMYNGKGACEFENKKSNKELGLKTASLEDIIKDAIEKKKK